MIEKGRVIELQGVDARVSVEPSDACKHCSACHLCYPSGKSRVIEVENSIGAHIGDVVHIEISDKVGFFALFLVFVLPVLLGLSGLLIGVGYSETYAILFGVAGLATGLGIAKIINDRISKKRDFLPRIVGIIRTMGA
ncbi:MAG: SoxR reducing system RseC family protein [candidate division WOR-3 bacterium]|nr:MAG: SoxR reducing system RseC family protein [candidate division WOR-3 bacterium]